MSLHVSPLRKAITSTPFLQSTPFRFKSSSIPSDAKIFKAEEIADDLVVELENATIYESSLEQPPYIPDLLDSSRVLQNISLQLSNLKDSAGQLFYKTGAWSPYKTPFFLRRQTDLVATSSHRAAKPKPSKKDSLSNKTTRKARSSVSRATKDTHLAPKAPRISTRGLRRQIVQRRVGSGSETEQVEGTFLSAAGKDEEGTAVWLNGVANSFQSIANGPIHAPDSNPRPRTRGYVKDAAPKRLWTAQFATKSISGALKVKPDLVLYTSDPLNKIKLTWEHAISFMEVTSKPNDSDMLLNLARKAYAIFMNQPGRRFLMAVSIAAQAFRLHIYDRSGVIHSRGHNIHTDADTFTSLLYFLTFAPPEHLGYDPTFLYSSIIPRSPSSPPRTIRVGTKIYFVIRVIFFSQLIRGRATLCLHVRDEHGKDFVVKDCWTHRGRKVTEEQILWKLKEHGIPGLPTLKEAWTVQIGGRDDTTDLRRPTFLESSANSRAMCEDRVHRRYLLDPLGSPVTEFSCIQEFLSIFIDILHGEYIHSFGDAVIDNIFVPVHELLVTVCRTLHRDISLNNILKYVCIIPWPATTEDEKKRECIIAKRNFHRGLLIDFDYALLLDSERSEVSPGERTVCFFSRTSIDHG